MALWKQCKFCGAHVYLSGRLTYNSAEKEDVHKCPKMIEAAKRRTIKKLKDDKYCVKCDRLKTQGHVLCSRCLAQYDKEHI